MSQLFQLYLRSWSAWAPGLKSAADWAGWAQAGAPRFVESDEAPALTFLPPPIRRRASRLTRAALAVAYGCMARSELSNVRSVFASRHGESETTLRILTALAEMSPVSPTDFSLSVHNASSGLFSIASGNRQATTALAAGPATLFSGLMESYLQLHRSHARAVLPAEGGVIGVASKGESVLLVIADQSLPIAFREPGFNHSPPYALAFHLDRHGLDTLDDEQDGVKLTINYRRLSPAPPASDSHLAGDCEAIRVISEWLLSKNQVAIVHQGSWEIELKKTGETHGLFRPIAA